jgi:hypothetical protein
MRGPSRNRAGTRNTAVGRPRVPRVVKGLAMRCAIVNGVPIVARGNFRRAVGVSYPQCLSATVHLPRWIGDSEEVLPTVTSMSNIFTYYVGNV